MGKFYDAAGKAFLHSVKFANFDFCSQFTMQYINAREGNVLTQNG